MAMLIGKNVSLMTDSNPLVPATYLALGLVEDLDLKDHIKFSFKYLYPISVLMVIAGLIFGIIHL